MSVFSFHVSLRLGRTTLSISRPSALMSDAVGSVAVDFFEFGRAATVHARCHKSLSTAQNYQTALRAFQRFAGEHLPIDQLTVDLVGDFERHLRRRGISLNTCSCYMRSLRSIYNAAVDCGVVSQQRPFRHVFTGRETTRKRAITPTEVHCLQTMPLGCCQLAFVRDLFLFSVYACGMPFVDLAHLRQSQIAGGYIGYFRHKTGQRIRVKILPCMQQIIDRYRRADSEYVFPILHSNDYREYLTRLTNYNRSLRRLQRRCCQELHLSSYVARHTWASLASEQLVELPVIQRALGHTSVRTTQIYMRELSDSHLDEANERLMHVLLDGDEKEVEL